MTITRVTGGRVPDRQREPKRKIIISRGNYCYDTGTRNQVITFLSETENFGDNSP